MCQPRVCKSNQYPYYYPYLRDSLSLFGPVCSQRAPAPFPNDLISPATFLCLRIFQILPRPTVGHAGSGSGNSRTGCARIDGRCAYPLWPRAVFFAGACFVMRWRRAIRTTPLLGPEPVFLCGPVGRFPATRLPGCCRPGLRRLVQCRSGVRHL